MKSATESKAGEQSKLTDASKPEFVNHGLQKFEEIRMKWLEEKPSKAGTTKAEKRGEVTAKTIDTEEVIERIFSQSGNGTLPTAVPLGQMIDILIDFWEADGLYD